MTTDVEWLKDLAAPFPPELIQWRVGATNAQKTKGIALAYIDARDVMQRLDNVVGAPFWQAKYSHVGAITVCEIGIWHPGTGCWVWKANGAGNTDVEAEKGACSDAFKRAAVLWGIGRYLYYLDSPWVTLEGKRIADGELPKLRALLEGKKVPDVKGKADSRAAFSQIQMTLRGFESPTRTIEELREYWKDPQVQDALLSMPSDFRDQLTRIKDEVREYLSA